MKNVTEDRGIKIDTKVLEMLEKAGSNAGSFRKLAKLCGISPVSISRWQGKVANQTVECIDWPNWEKLWGSTSEPGAGLTLPEARASRRTVGGIHRMSVGSMMSCLVR